MRRESGVNLTKYRGKYVAIVSKKVVASGENAKLVLDRARAKYPRREIVLRKIPEEETLILVAGCG
ncbi:MAG: DUF5678 domain-containing protein [Candidatus Hadarchaeales archaeon]